MEIIKIQKANTGEKGASRELAFMRLWRKNNNMLM